MNPTLSLLFVFPFNLSANKALRVHELHSQVTAHPTPATLLWPDDLLLVIYYLSNDETKFYVFHFRHRAQSIPSDHRSTRWSIFGQQASTNQGAVQHALCVQLLI